MKLKLHLKFYLIFLFFFNLELKYDIGYNLIKWVYTDIFDNQKRDENFYLDMMREASQFELKDLKEKLAVLFLLFKKILLKLNHFKDAKTVY